MRRMTQRELVNMCAAYLIVLPGRKLFGFVDTAK